MMRIHALYEPPRDFSNAGGIMLLLGAALTLRLSYYYLTAEGPSGHMQSFLAGTMLIALGVVTVLIGVVSDLMPASRHLRSGGGGNP